MSIKIPSVPILGNHLSYSDVYIRYPPHHPIWRLPPTLGASYNQTRSVAWVWGAGAIGDSVEHAQSVYGFFLWCGCDHGHAIVCGDNYYDVFVFWSRADDPTDGIGDCDWGGCGVIDFGTDIIARPSLACAVLIIQRNYISPDV